MDALASFVFLTDNLPIWAAKLDELSRQISERHAEFTKLSRSSIGSLTRRKTNSTESLRPNDAANTEDNPSPISSPSAPSTPPIRVEVNPAGKHIFRDHREAQLRRKRKSGSLFSTTSGPPRFRSRMSMIVYYDSEIQDNFQWLVRNIAGARNNLRKWKTAAGFKARMASMAMEESPFAGEGAIILRNPNIPRMPKSGLAKYNTFGDATDEFASLINPNLPQMADDSNGKPQMRAGAPEAFETADKDLEAAQTLCEVGAHQFLRDGNCSEELGGTKERFDRCLDLATQQATLLRQDQSQLQAKTANAAVVEIEIEHPDHETLERRARGHYDLSVDPKLQSSTVSGGLAVLDGITYIEVDEDEDNESVHIDLTAFRSNRRR